MGFLERPPPEPVNTTTSSADPTKLISYSQTGLELSTQLQAVADQVTTAWESLKNAPGGSDVVSLTNVEDELQDLAGDWYHLDEFVGDVGLGFALAQNPNWDGNVDSLDGGVITANNNDIGQLGEVGFADRDDAAQQAIKDAESIENAIDEGTIDPHDLQQLADDVARGQYDPYYAVRLAEILGVEGMLAVPELIQDTLTLPGQDVPEDYPSALELVSPFSVVLSTAMDTRSRTPDDERLDPDNADLPGDKRLDETWVDEFEAGMHDSNDIGKLAELPSVLLHQSQLPADVLRDIDSGHMRDVLSEGGLFPTTTGPNPDPAIWGGAGLPEVNLMEAISNNPNFANEWLAEEGSDGPSNLELLLQYDGNVDAQGGRQGSSMILESEYGDDFGVAGSHLLESGLAGPHEPDTTRELFRDAVETVADEGELHYDEFAPGLGEATRVHIEDVVDAVGVREDSEDGVPSQDATKVFLNSIMGNNDAADSVYAGVSNYTQGQLDPTVTAEPHARDIGSLLGAVTDADRIAAEQLSTEEMAGRLEVRQGFLDVLSALKVGGGLLPGNAGVLTSVVDIGAAEMSGNYGLDDIHGDAAADLGSDLESIETTRNQITSDIATDFATYDYEVRHSWTSDDILTELAGSDEFADHSAQEFSFFTPDGNIKPVGEMTDLQRRAFDTWVDDVVGRETWAGDQVADLVALGGWERQG